jgi:hypothetical protein
MNPKIEAKAKGPVFIREYDQVNLLVVRLTG